MKLTSSLYTELFPQAIMKFSSSVCTKIWKENVAFGG